MLNTNLKQEWSSNSALKKCSIFSSRYAYPKPFIAKFPCKILQRLVIEWSIRIWVFCEVNNWFKQRYHSPGPMRTLNIKLLLDTRLGNSTQLISSTNQFIPKIPHNFNFFLHPVYNIKTSSVISFYRWRSRSVWSPPHKGTFLFIVEASCILVVRLKTSPFETARLKYFLRALDF